MTVNEYIQSKNYHEGSTILKRIVCANSFEFSAQASASHYCYPRFDNKDYYNEVELGFPSKEIPEWLEYAEDIDNPTETVYGYVPVELVDMVIEANGGIDIKLTFGENQ